MAIFESADIPNYQADFILKSSSLIPLFIKYYVFLKDYGMSEGN
jgi:hypothetical protein